MTAEMQKKIWWVWRRFRGWGVVLSHNEKREVWYAVRNEDFSRAYIEVREVGQGGLTARLPFRIALELIATMNDGDVYGWVAFATPNALLKYFFGTWDKFIAWAVKNTWTHPEDLERAGFVSAGFTNITVQGVGQNGKH